MGDLTVTVSPRQALAGAVFVVGVLAAVYVLGKLAAEADALDVAAGSYARGHRDGFDQGYYDGTVVATRALPDESEDE